MTTLQVDRLTEARTLIDQAEHHASQAVHLLWQAGHVLTTAKANTPHGQWTTRLAEAGITSQRASEAIRLARLNETELPGTVRKALAAVTTTNRPNSRRVGSSVLEQRAPADGERWTRWLEWWNHPERPPYVGAKYTAGYDLARKIEGRLAAATHQAERPEGAAFNDAGDMAYRSPHVSGIDCCCHICLWRAADRFNLSTPTINRKAIPK